MVYVRDTNTKGDSIMYKTTSKKHRNNHYDLSGDIERIKDAFADTAKDVRGKASEVFSQSIKDVRVKSTDMKDNMETYLSERPFKTLLVSMLSGILIGGTLMRRKKRASFRHRE